MDSGETNANDRGISLSVDESSALQNALRTYVSELRMEIVDTDNPQYRRGLKDERAALESVLTKLDEAIARGEQRDDEGRVVVRFIGVWSIG